MKIFKKEKKVVGLVTRHLEAVQACTDAAESAVHRFVSGDLEGAKEKALEADETETTADTLRREIREVLFSGAYLPLIREDVHNLVSGVDRVANAAEDCADFFLSQRPVIPDEMKDAYLDITRAATASVKPLLEATKVYFKPKGKMKAAREHTRDVGLRESEVDQHEWNLTRDIFGSSLELARKLHLKAALDHICEISDRAEDAADRLELAGLKAVL